MEATGKATPVPIQSTSTGKSMVSPGEYTIQYGVLNDHSTGDVLVVSESTESGTSRIERHLVEKGFVVYATEPMVQVTVERPYGAHQPKRPIINRLLPDFLSLTTAPGDEFDPVYLPSTASRAIMVRVASEEPSRFLSDPDEFQY